METPLKECHKCQLNIAKIVTLMQIVEECLWEMAWSEQVDITIISVRLSVSLEEKDVQMVTILAAKQPHLSNFSIQING